MIYRLSNMYANILQSLSSVPAMIEYEVTCFWNAVAINSLFLGSTDSQGKTVTL